VSVRKQLRSSRVMAVLRVTDQAVDPVALAERLVESGVTAIEYTMDSPNPLATVERLRQTFDDSVAIGAGTVTTVSEVDALVDVGATFVVSPHTDPALIERALTLEIEPIPGVLTPTEAQRARSAGASILKLFPAGPMGINYLRTMSAPFRGIDWIPTGGIQLSDVADWLDAGALCVGVGSALWTNPDPQAELQRLPTPEIAS
jgi:2-dehydro-3-deoxyphosphogluconate aldolase/(4S)-4-hydroxy-2-oxoglutarate aldolase